MKPARSVPEAPAGRGPLPNFFIVGAMRSGTTSLARYLGAHPEVFMAPAKEIHFFDTRFSQGLDWYRSHFASATEPWVGEATQTYMYVPEALARMAQVVPDARLLAILRNPVDRAYSHYWLKRARGREPLEFAEAIAVEEDRLRAGDVPSLYSYSYLDRGRYLAQLRRVVEHYPRTALHVVILEHLQAAPEEEYGAICRFLGVREDFLPPNLGAPLNSFRTYRSKALRRMAPRLPAPVRRIVGRLNAEPASYPPMDPTLRRDLLARFAEDNRALAAWLGRDLSVWST